MDELLDAALELPAAEREAFVAAACGGDEALRREVSSLLGEEPKLAGGFMEHPAMKVAAQALAQQTALVNVSPVGREVGPYRIERLIGAGGMGEVYLAQDLRLSRKVALKILPAEFVADPERVLRFEREARAVSALNHPNIVTVYDVGEERGWHYIATEFVEGRTLRDLAGDGLKLKEMLSYASQAAEALSAAHGAGVTHRDIKPENIMVRADGYVKVLDFGLAKLAESRASDAKDVRGAVETRAGVVMGTLAYMSPEQAAGDVVDSRTDIWSLGVVLYEMAVGKTPFAAGDRRATINAILSSEPEAARASVPELPAEFDHVLSKALEKDRELRYQTASDFRADLRRLLREIDSSASWSSEKVIAARRRRARRWLLPASVAAGLASVLVAGLLAWPFFKEDPAGPDWSRATHTQLTDQAGTEFYPSLAPDGRSFVYASKDGDDYDIFWQRVGGKNPTPLTKDSPSDDTQPAFSPDGERIAFRSERAPAGVYVMEATGENARRVSEGGFQPSWSPDGREVVYCDAGHDLPTTRNTTPSALWVVNVETGAKRMLVRQDAMQPAWSPHGQRVAFWFMPPGVGRRDIATVSRDGGDPIVVTKDASTNWNPVWSPDGRHLYFASDRSGNMNFWRVRVDEATGEVLSEPEAVVTPSKYSRHLNFSRDGKRMIYVQTDDQSNIQAAEFDARGERVVGDLFWITRGDRAVSRPELSPDGTRFVIRMPRRTQDDIVILNRDGTNWRDLTNDHYFDRYPRWSPDGRRIAFVSDRSGIYEVWMIDADGTNLRQVTAHGAVGTAFPIWSPDGARLLYRRDRDYFIIDPSRPAAEQTPQTLPPPADPSHHFVAWDWSPDGSKLAGTLGKGVAHRVAFFSFETNRYEQIADFSAQPMWMSDSRRLVFAHGSKIYVADTATRRLREIISRQQEQIRTVGISRDSRLLYFTVVTTESDIWLLNLE
ncbi:MAG TPA: protein kinase [Pyrinomonadaceae bacterium]|nr:protein kinase [Pyrinomonadaceae bacterium]